MHGFVWIDKHGKYLAIHKKEFPVATDVASVVSNIDRAYVGMRIPSHVDTSAHEPLMPLHAYAIETRTVTLTPSHADSAAGIAAHKAKASQ